MSCELFSVFAVFNPSPGAPPNSVACFCGCWYVSEYFRWQRKSLREANRLRAKAASFVEYVVGSLRIVSVAFPLFLRQSLGRGRHRGFPFAWSQLHNVGSVCLCLGVNFVASLPGVVWHSRFYGFARCNTPHAAAFASPPGAVCAPSCHCCLRKS